MEIYRRYPMLRPYVGNRFGEGSKPKLLLVGESHYLPARSTQHLSSTTWYSGSSKTLDEQEIGWISTAQIIRNSRAEGFKNRAHSIWRNAFKVINEFGPKYPDYAAVADDVAFCNFFLRPGRKGRSLRVVEQDMEVANRVFPSIVRELSPAALVFLSVLARRHARLERSSDPDIVVVPHPGCVHWNHPAKKYGGRAGRQVLADFIKTTTWPS